MNRILAYGSFALALALGACKAKQAPVAQSSDRSHARLSEKEKLSLDATFYDASRLKVLGNFQEAIKKFEECISIDPNNDAALYEIAKIYNQMGKNKDALPYIRKAANLNQKNTWYQQLFSECLIQTDNFAEAIQVNQRLVKNFPSRIDFYYELANSYLYASRPEDAIRVYDKIEEKNGVSEEVSVQKQKIYSRLGKVDKAIEEIQKLVNAFPNEAKYYGMLAQLYQQKGLDVKAFELFTKLQEIDPKNPYVHLSLADYYRSKGDKEKSFEELKLAFQNPSLEIDNKMRVLLQFYDLGKVQPDIKDQGYELCKILVAVHPDDAKSHSIYGDFLYRDKKLSEAKTQYETCLTLDKSRYPIWLQLISINEELKDFKSVSEVSKQAIELFPSEPGAYLFNGEANLQIKRYNEAIESLLQGKDYVVDNKTLLAQFYAMLGDAYNRTRDFKRSDEFYQKSIDQQPENDNALNNWAYYLSLRNDKLERAESMSKKSLDIAPNNASYCDTYAWILYKLGKYEEAKTWLNKAMQNGGTGSAAILEHYGDVLYKLGEKEKALEYWNKAKNTGDGSEFLEKKIADKKLYE